MKPIEFTESNTTFAKNQPEYITLPAYVRPGDPLGKAVVCWQLTWRQRWLLFWRGKLWHSMLTFNRPLQPQLLSVDKPEIP